MNLSKILIYLNCGKAMKQGKTDIGPYGMSQFRFCDNCGLKVFLFTEAKGFKYSLVRKCDDEIQPTNIADGKDQCTCGTFSSRKFCPVHGYVE